MERLHRLQIFPIVLLLHFKSAKQIKEIQEKDSRYPADKITLKAAKEMYEHALKLESDYRHYISGIHQIEFLFVSINLIAIIFLVSSRQRLYTVQI